VTEQRNLRGQICTRVQTGVVPVAAEGLSSGAFLGRILRLGSTFVKGFDSLPGIPWRLPLGIKDGMQSRYCRKLRGASDSCIPRLSKPLLRHFFACFALPACPRKMICVQPSS